MLVTRTSTKAIAVLVIALACVFGAPAVANAGFVPPPLQNQATAQPNATLNVIVLGQPGKSTDAVRDRVKSAGGSVETTFSVINGVVADLTGSQVKALGRSTSIRSITPNGRVRGQSVTSGLIWPLATGVSSLLSSSTLSSFTRKAPGIAIVDSGVDTSRKDFGGRIAAIGGLHRRRRRRPSRRQRPRHARRRPRSRSRSSPSASPTSNLYSLKVVRPDGTAYAGDVIEAADWIYKNAFNNNIRVANFSLRNAFPNYAGYDPLDAAVHRLWLSGTVVVASAGNNGSGRMLYAPANDPFVITVGASDIADTVTRRDDSNAPWTSYGYTAEGFAKPELAAPGRWMIGPVPTGSVLATTFADRLLNPGYMWMSGTSFSAPVVAGTRCADPRAPSLVHAGSGQGRADADGEDRAARDEAVARRRRGRRRGRRGPHQPAEPEQEPLPVRPHRRGRRSELRLGRLERLRRRRTPPGRTPPGPTRPGPTRPGRDASWTDASWTDASWTDASWTDASWTDASWTDASWTDASWTDASWTDSTDRE